MRSAHPRKLQVYQTQNGREPFTEWLKSIRDRRTRTRIQDRLERLEIGNVGDCEPVGDGVYELRLHFGAGYRIYFGEIGNTIVFCSVVAINHPRREILHAQKPIGWNTRKHTYEKI